MNHKIVQEDRALYRDRIYQSYVHARQDPLAPASIAGLQARLHTHTAMMRRVGPPDRHASILDLGCGHGAVVQTLNQLGYANVRGVDGSPQQVEAAHRLGIEGVTQGDILQTLAETGAEQWDAMVTFDVIEHFTKDELIGFIDEVHRILRPGGRWIIHMPNGESPFGGKVLCGDFTHELAFTRTSLTQVLKVSGFNEVDCFEDTPVVHGVKSAIRALLWRLIRWFWLAYIAIETGGTDRRAIFTQNFLAVAVKNT